MFCLGCISRAYESLLYHADTFLLFAGRLFPCNDPNPVCCVAVGIQCNSDPALILAMNALGCGFSGPSMRQIDTLLSLGVKPSGTFYWSVHMFFLGFRYVSHSLQMTNHQWQSTLPLPWIWIIDFFSCFLCCDLECIYFTRCHFIANRCWRGLIFRSVFWSGQHMRMKEPLFLERNFRRVYLTIGWDRNHYIYLTRAYVDVLLSNPWPSISSLRLARERNIGFLSFDNKLELEKISVHCPNAQLFVMVSPQTTHSRHSTASYVWFEVCVRFYLLIVRV